MCVGWGGGGGGGGGGSTTDLSVHSYRQGKTCDINNDNNNDDPNTTAGKWHLCRSC